VFGPLALSQPIAAAQQGQVDDLDEGLGVGGDAGRQGCERGLDGCGELAGEAAAKAGIQGVAALDELLDGGRRGAPGTAGGWL
jgi:hypothetical protein